MTEFTPYPAAAEAEPGAPGDLYVVAVTSTLQRGVLAPDPVTAPMTHQQAMDLLDRIARDALIFWVARGGALARGRARDMIWHGQRSAEFR